MSHPLTRTRPPAAVLDGPTANPFGPREPGTYGATALDDARLLRAETARAPGPVLDVRRTDAGGGSIPRVRGRGTGAAGVAPAGDTASRAPVDAPFADPPAAAEGHATDPYGREGRRRRSPVGRSGGAPRLGRARSGAGPVEHGRPVGRIVKARHA